MAMTRTQVKTILKAAGVPDEQIKEAVDELIDLHTETVNAIKGEKATLQEELDGVKADLETAKNGGDWKAKYDTLNDEFTAYKDAQSKAEAYKAKETAYRKLLAENGVSDKRIDGVVKYDKAYIDGLELDDAGAFKGVKDVVKSITDNWSDFITAKGAKGADVDNPPARGGSSVTPEQFKKMSYNDRLKLYNENPETYNELKGMI